MGAAPRDTGPGCGSHRVPPRRTVDSYTGVMTNSLPGLIILVIQIAAVVGAAFSLVHAIRQRPDAFTAAGKWTKQAWVGVLAASLAVLVLLGPFGFFGIGLAGIVASCIYLVDVRPKVDEIQRPRW